MREQRHFYAFDPALDDSRKWRDGTYTCGDCGYEFIYVCRVDREPSCPKCVVSDRWVVRS